MKAKRNFASISILCFFMLLSCAPSNRQVLATNESQVKLRAIQTRAYDTTDKQMMLRAIIATLQDLGFIINGADHVLGTVSGTKLERNAIRIT